MSAIRPLLVLLVLGPQDGRIPDLVSRLDDDSIQVRSEAARDLVALGSAALPELRRSLDAAQGERRERLAEIVRKIVELDRLSALLRPASRITLDARDRPLREVLASIAEQSGTPVLAREVPEDARVSVAVRSAGLWEALDAACRAGGRFMYDAEGGGAVVRKGPYADVPRRYARGFAVLLGTIDLSSSAAFGDPDRYDEMALHLTVAWEKGTRPSFVRIRLEAASDDTGKDLLPTEDEDGNADETIAVSPGEISAGTILLSPRLPDPKAKKISRLRIEAECGFVLRHSGVTFKDPGGRGPERLECPEFAATLLSADREEGRFVARIKVEPRNEAAAAIETDGLLLRSAAGRTLRGLVGEASTDGTSTTYAVAWELPGKEKPAELSIRIPAEIHRERIDAEFKDVPLE